MAETTIPPNLPTPEQQQRAKWDLLLRDLELRGEQIRQLKSFEGWRLLFTGLGSAAALLAAGGVVGGLLVRLLSGHG
jgi:hypothetical protein